MTVRRWHLATCALAGLIGWTAAPGVARYKVDIKTQVTQDLTVVGQGPQTQEFTTTGFVSVSAKDSAGGQVLTMVLDSVIPGEGSPFPPDLAKSAAGTTWTGFRDARGKVGELTTTSENPAAGSLQGIVQVLLPPVKAGAREGQSWTDTTETDRDGMGVRTVTNFQTSGETANGAKVLRVAGASSSAISGQQTGPQGSMSIEGTGAGTSSWLLAADGTCLSGTFSNTQSISVTVASLPEPIPVTVKTDGTSTLLK